VYQLICTEQNASDNSEVDRSLQNCSLCVELAACYPSGASNLQVAPRFYETLLTPTSRPVLLKDENTFLSDYS